MGEISATPAPGFMIAAAINLLACMAVFSIVEWLWPSPDPHKWWRRPLLIDICSWLILPLALSAGISLAVLIKDGVLAALPHEGFWQVLPGIRTHIAALPALTQVVIAFIVVDFFCYWLHRAYHHYPFLWSFHVFHHSAEDLDWLTTLRVHPVSEMLNNALMAAPLLLAGFSVKTMAVANSLIAVSALLTHANVPWTFGRLRYLFVSPVFHQWHHARLEGGLEPPPSANFGAALSIWDRLFRTGSLASDKRPASFGIEGSSRSNLATLLFQPQTFLFGRIIGKRLEPTPVRRQPATPQMTSTGVRQDKAS
jgi:sterol desaturase/sphingolipid hydroxylase (fatty acid hydroxylase superfamily)